PTNESCNSALAVSCAGEFAFEFLFPSVLYSAESLF
ncbi:MAG: hypothetical protein ACI96P_001422, partial [Candidatus Azotimanducaceae bacterium]